MGKARERGGSIPGAASAGVKEIGRDIQIVNPVVNSLLKAAGVPVPAGQAVGQWSFLPEAAKEEERWQQLATELSPTPVGQVQAALKGIPPTREHPATRLPEQQWWRLGGMTIYRLDMRLAYHNKMEQLRNAERAQLRIVNVGSPEFLGKKVWEIRRLKRQAATEAMRLRKERFWLMDRAEKMNMPELATPESERVLGAEIGREVSP
jgi:hypothetical protein